MFRHVSAFLQMIAALLLATSTHRTAATPMPTSNPKPTMAESSGEDIDSVSHVITRHPENYTTDPQAVRPLDGRYSPNTNMNKLRQAGSHAFLRSDRRTPAYAATDARTSAGPGGGNAMADVSAVVEGGNHFTFDLYRQLRGEQGNLFLSPASISLALAMTYAGAAGKTEAEMAKTLHFEMPKNRLHGGMGALQAAWRTTDRKQGYRLKVANRLWAQQSYEFLDEFLHITRNPYGAELARLDFRNAAETSRRAINGWVEDQTENKIRNLISSADLLRDARLVLTNAVYFQGDWSAPFEKKLTKMQDFYVSSTQKLESPLMNILDDFRYAEADGLQILELPYGDRSFSMVVLLPEKVDGLSDMEAKLSVDNLRKWSQAMNLEEVIVFLPKFKTEFEFELKETLRSLGMVSAFDAQSADFSGMTGGKDLFISAVLHKAFIDVNEKGTEAAAATGVIMTPKSAPNIKPRKLPVFRADHPFVFLIRDNRNGAILFLGRVIDPTK